jgi:hypothetical protein
MSELDHSSKLDDIDVNTLTASEAVSLFQSKVAEQQRNTGDDLIKAWAVTRTLNPTLFARISVRDEAQTPANVQLVGRYNDSTGIIKGPIAPLPWTENRGGLAPSLASKLMPRAPGCFANDAASEGDDLSRKAHIASSQANSKGSHQDAATAHVLAAEAQNKAGDSDAVEMHRRMAAYHHNQASGAEKT